jgi:prepilin-type N-terminal cleavage/methylation domain-containing protein
MKQIDKKKFKTGSIYFLTLSPIGFVRTHQEGIDNTWQEVMKTHGPAKLESMTMIRNRKAFSLIELVIVIVILGIILAIAVPRISSGTKSAGESALRSNLSTIRTAIDSYYVEHNRVYPADVGDGINSRKKFETFLNHLTLYSDADGIVSSDKDPSFPLGPYIRRDVPEMTVGVNAGSNDIRFKDSDDPISANPGEPEGWFYNVRTGEIIANADEVGSDGNPYYSW